MLAVFSPTATTLNEHHTNGAHQSSENIEAAFSNIILGDGDDDDDFADFSSGNYYLLESKCNDDLYDLFRDSDDVLIPDLEMDPNDLLISDFSLSSGDEYYSDDINTTTTTTTASVDGLDRAGNCFTSQNDQENMVSKRDPDKSISSSKKQVYNNRHSKAHRSSSKPLGVSSKRTSKECLQGKRKVKVDWTPELHRRFVQAVEQLGVDKAVPSRILEIMGIDCLTRHNIASHLQKYRSHRKHSLAREAEAASWSQRRHALVPVTAGTVLGKRERGSPWLVPSIGFPPMAPPPQHIHGHNNRPFHVWGHPSVDQSLRPVLWPKPFPHSANSSQSLPIWPLRHGVCQGAPCFPTPLGTTTTLPVQPLQGYHPPHAVYKLEPCGGFGVPAGQLRRNPLLDLHPSKESLLDAAIGDVLKKPWLPLPIGLKPPELDSVMGELQRNGVPNIPPSCA